MWPRDVFPEETKVNLIFPERMTLNFLYTAPHLFVKIILEADGLFPDFSSGLQWLNNGLRS